MTLVATGALTNVALLLTLPGTGSSSYANNIAGLTQGACNYLGTVATSPGGLPGTTNYIMNLAIGLGVLSGITIGVEVPFPVPPLPPFFTVLWSGYEISPYVNTIFESTPVTFPYESILNDFFVFIFFPL